MVTVPCVDEPTNATLIRALVVEDHEPFRQFICATLEQRPDVHVVATVSDGLAAVLEAEKIQPELILLDIGLPSLNGIEAARRIRKLSPQSKIIFLTQESSSDLVREAFNLGAKGYVVKANAGSELLAAVEAVCKGGKFVSNGLSSSGTSHRHVAQFYEDDISLLVGFIDFVEPALQAGGAVIVLASKDHLQIFLRKLKKNGVNVAAAIEQQRYIPLEVGETLATFMVDDMPDPVRYNKAVRDLFAGAAKGPQGERRCVSAWGEAAPILWAEGNAEAAIQIEHMWHGLIGEYEVDSLCGYVLNKYQREQESHFYHRICAEHYAVL